MNDIVLHLIYNASLLLALGIVCEASYLLPKKWGQANKVIGGLMIGFIGILVMTLPFTLSKGITFDTRSILISVSAMIFGPVQAIIAAVMTILYRIIFIGGAGTLTGCSVIAVSAVLGLLARRWEQKKKPKHRWLLAYLFGVIVHIAMLACMIFMPDPVMVLSQISLPVMTIYPVVTVLLGMLLLHQRERSDNLIKLVEADSRYKSLFAENHAAMLLIDPDNGHIMEANPAANIFYGWTNEEFRTMNISQINTIPPEDIAANMRKASSRESNHFIYKHKKASGEVVDVEVYSGPIRIDEKTLLYSIIHDISERTASEAALLESENRFRLLVESAPAAIIIRIGPTVVFANKTAAELFGAASADALIGLSIQDRVHPDYREMIDQRILKLDLGEKAGAPLEEVFLRLDGSSVSVEVTAIPVRYNNQNGTIIFAQDITERKRNEAAKLELEAQMRQQQKLEAIGTLAGGVAHEINNPINGIMNYAELILDALDKLSPQAGYAREIIHETDRIAAIVKNLLQFSRQEKQTHSYASVYDIIDQTVMLINTIIKKDQIRMILQVDEGLPQIKCRSQQIQQVLMNLLTNARDTLNEKYPEFDENKVIFLMGSLFERDGRRWVRLTVQDNGMGIPEEIRERIFEPFFSTKPKDKGTGLGLSISHGIVKDHHGSITMETEEGQFTRVILELPVDNGWEL